MSVRAIEAEVSIKSGIEAECTIGRGVVVHEDANLESLTATENGQYEPAQGVDGFSDVTVAVPERQPVTEPLSVTANGNYEPSEGVDGFSDVTVSVPERVPVTESLSATENGTYEPDTGVDGYDKVVVDVPPYIPDIEPLTATANGAYTAEGDGYNPVVVNVPPTIPDISPLTVTEDGVYQASGDGYNPVTVSTGAASLRQEIASAETASGCDPLVGGLTALTTYANEVTGQEDETLSDAVESLVQGFGGGNAKSVQVIAENEIYQNAALVRDWLLSVVPQSSFAVIYKNNFVYTQQSTRGQASFILGVIINNTPTLAMRFLSNLTVVSVWASEWMLSVDAGDAYTILYVE